MTSQEQVARLLAMVPYLQAHPGIGVAEVAADYGITGHNILSSGFNLEIVVREEAGAFVCGEETALLNSIEGKLPPVWEGVWEGLNVMQLFKGDFQSLNLFRGFGLSEQVRDLLLRYVFKCSLLNR